MNATTERRSAVLDRAHVVRGTEVRVAGTPAEPRLTGHAAVWDSLSEPLGGGSGGTGFRERIKKGFFAPALRNRDDVKLLVNHQGTPLARTKSGTLTLWEDEIGLAFEARLDPTDPDVAAILPKVRRQDLSQMSFAFTVGSAGSTWEDTPSGMVRTLVSITSLADISLVTTPAYPQTDVQARSRYGYPSSAATLTTERQIIADLRARRAKMDHAYRTDPGVRFRTDLATKIQARKRAEGAGMGYAILDHQGFLRAPE